MIYLIQQKKDLDNLDTELSISETESKIIDSISKNVNTSTLILFTIV